MQQRQFPRIDARLKVEIEHGEFIGVTEDLSLGGMFLRTSRKLTKGARLHLGIELPKGQAEAVVEVCWLRRSHLSEEIGVGVKFVQLSSEMTAYLDGTKIPNGKAPVARED